MRSPANEVLHQQAHKKTFPSHTRLHYSYIVCHAAHLLSLHDIGLSRGFFHIRDSFTVSHAHPDQSSTHHHTNVNVPKCTAYAIRTQSTMARILCLCTRSVCLAAFVIYMILSPRLMRARANHPPPRHTKIPSQMHHIRYSHAVAHLLSLQDIGLSRSFCHIYDPFSVSYARPGQSSSPKAYKDAFPSCTRLHCSHAVGHAAHLLSLQDIGLSRSFCHIRDPFAAFYARPGQSSSTKTHKNTFPSAPHTLWLALFLVYCTVINERSTSPGAYAALRASESRILLIQLRATLLQPAAQQWSLCRLYSTQTRPFVRATIPILNPKRWQGSPPDL